MPRLPLAELDGRRFDVVVVGAGATGCGAAQHIAAAGYAVLVVDKGDYASGSSSRSSRLLHCGLRYLEQVEGIWDRDPSAWDAFRHPHRFLRQCRRARDAMQCRAELVRTMPERLRPITFCFPVYADGYYRPWQVGLGMRLLSALGPGDVPLADDRLSPREAAATPLLRWLRDPDSLEAVFTFTEYIYDWAERMVLDTLIDARRLGAVARNYTPARGLRRDADGDWRVTLGDAFDEGALAEVTAPVVVNAAGPWTDRVNRLATDAARRRVRGTKGAHVAVRLPPECAPYGVSAITRQRSPFYIVPWRDLHYIGPTHTAFEGDLDTVRATAADIEYLLGEANHLLPGLGLGPTDVLFTWAGVRPLTYASDEPAGIRGYTFHDLAGDGLPNVLAMTGSPILSFRPAGRRLAGEVGRRIPPSRTAAAPDFAAKPFHSGEASPGLLDTEPEVTLAELRHVALTEDPVTLADLLFRRVGVGWTGTMAREGALKAAETVADILGWDAATVEREVAAYLDHIAGQFGARRAHPLPATAEGGSASSRMACRAAPIV